MKRGQGALKFLSVCLTVILVVGITLVFAMPLPPVDAQGLKDNAKTLHPDVIQTLKREAQGQRIDARLDKRALVHALQKGGYVLYLRHAITDRSRIDADRVNLPNCATQRNLSAEGQK